VSEGSREEPESRGELRGESWLPWLPNLLLAGACIAVFLGLASQRLSYPFELEWMEGGSLHHLARTAEGAPLYPAPGIEFVPFPYPPLFYHAAGLVVPFLGVSFQSLRLVSLISALGVFLLIFAFVKRETGIWPLALTTAGLFAATYRESGAYMDVARIDSFFLFWVLASAYVLRRRDDLIGALVAALFAFLATWTKQTGLVALGPLMLWCAHRDWQRHGWTLSRWSGFLGFTLGSVLAVAIATLALNRGEDAHFLFYILGAQSGHEIRWGMIPHFFWHDLFWILPVSCIAIGVAAFVKPRMLDRSGVLFYAALGVGILAACLVPRIKVGGALNNLIPAHALIAILGGIALATLLEAWRRRRWALPAIQLAIALQFVLLFYDPRIALPSADDEERGRRLVKRLSQIEGEVLIPAQSYLAGMAGKRVYAHQMPVDDLSRSGLAEAEALREDFARALRDGRFEIVIDSTSRFLQSFPDDTTLKEGYRLSGPVFGDGRTLIPRSGFQVGPGEAWIRRDVER